ncbi:hypothetical protein BGX30_004833 [Mortierella sp. GBA39]|nr:hypothetical protein BGX30_004833 [Mortierella sp. GBA39]
MLAAMDKAEDHLHIQFYIFWDDDIGNRFKDIMVRKAKAGVKVRLLCDGFGSYRLGRRRGFIQELKEAGVELHFFLPPLLAMIDRRINYRNHRKIIVVDGTKGFVGGLNVGDDYLGKYQKMGYWRDTHLEIEGDAVYFLQNVFLSDWKLASGERLSDPALFPKHQCEADEQVQIVSSGPDQDWNAIQEMCFGAITVAKKRIWITSPYFIPDQGIYEGLKTAAVSGVDVRIIIPLKADSRLVHLASLSYIEDLLLAGVKFYEYQKGFIHAKVMIVDDLMASVGTANMDMRSFFCNFELTAALFEQSSIDRLVKDFKEDMSQSHQINNGYAGHAQSRSDPVVDVGRVFVDPPAPQQGQDDKDAPVCGINPAEGRIILQGGNDPIQDQKQAARRAEPPGLRVFDPQPYQVTAADLGQPGRYK